MIHRPEIKDGDIITADIFNNIYDAIQEVDEYSHLSKFELEQQITRLQKQVEQNRRTIKILGICFGILAIIFAVSIVFTFLIIFGVI